MENLEFESTDDMVAYMRSHASQNMPLRFIDVDAFKSTQSRMTPNIDPQCPGGVEWIARFISCYEKAKEPTYWNNRL